MTHHFDLVGQDDKTSSSLLELDGDVWKVEVDAIRTISSDSTTPFGPWYDIVKLKVSFPSGEQFDNDKALLNTENIFKKTQKRHGLEPDLSERTTSASADMNNIVPPPGRTSLLHPPLLFLLRRKGWLEPVPAGEPSISCSAFFICGAQLKPTQGQSLVAGHFQPVLHSGSPLVKQCKVQCIKLSRTCEMVGLFIRT